MTLKVLFRAYFKIINNGMAKGVEEFEKRNDPEEELLTFFSNLIDPFVDFLCQKYPIEILVDIYPEFNWRKLIKKHRLK